MPANEPNDTMVSAGAPGAGGFGAPAVPGEVGTLGPYRLIKELGKGGMGAVYAALDTRLARRLALKVMLPEFAADRAARERFLREAQAAAKITHDNVVIVYEADERDGVPYIAMQCLEGYPLDEFLKSNTALTVQQVVRIATETASGLAAAHALGLVHRDIKPANLWLEAPNGRVKVLDFGLAKPVDTEVELTKSGAVVGTPAYMSPEQGRGLKVDARSDLFSLGSVLYKLCTGAMPFTGPTTMAVLMALGNDEPTPVRERNPNVPEALAALIHQLLAKKPEARPQSATELVARLRAIANELGARSTAPTQPLVMMPQVVYAVTPVSGPSANPFADLDSPDTEQVSRETSEPSVPALEPARRSRWPLFAGGAALVALVVVVALALKGGSKPEPPDDTANKDKGKEKDKGPKQPPPKVPAVDPDRRAAEYVVSVGGTVRVDGDERDRKTAADLPKERFALTLGNLSGCTAVTDAGLAHFKDCKGLTHLDLYGCTAVTDAGLAHFKDCKGLRVLGLEVAAVTDAGLANFKDCKALQRLYLSGTKVTDAGLAQFKDCKDLTLLNLGGCTAVTDAGLANFKDCKGLTSLNLGGCTAVTGTGLSHLKELNGLRQLYLNHTPTTNAGLAHLKELKELMLLSLDDVPLTDAGLAHVKELKSLTHLSVGRTKVTDAGLAHLKELKNLTILNLNGSPVTDAGLVHLKELKSLQALGLNATQVTDAGVEYLKGLSELTTLDLSGSQVTAKGREALRAARPACRITYQGGVIEPTDVDRTAAEWVLAQGGLVRVNDEDRDRKALAELPKEPFTLTWVSLHAAQVTDAGLEQLKGAKNLLGLGLSFTKVTDAGLVHLKGLTRLIDLRVTGTGVTDAGLTHLKDLKGLTILSLDATKVSDAGLAHLKELPALKRLGLKDAPVSDAGLVHLKELKTLRSVYFNGSKVTAKGAAELADALPACRIEHDGGVIEPKK